MPDAYERLILDVTRGVQLNFVRRWAKPDYVAFKNRNKEKETRYIYIYIERSGRGRGGIFGSIIKSATKCGSNEYPLQWWARGGLAHLHTAATQDWCGFSQSNSLRVRLARTGVFFRETDSSVVLIFHSSSSPHPNLQCDLSFFTLSVCLSFARMLQSESDEMVRSLGYKYTEYSWGSQWDWL